MEGLDPGVGVQEGVALDAPAGPALLAVHIAGRDRVQEGRIRVLGDLRDELGPTRGIGEGVAEAVPAHAGEGIHVIRWTDDGAAHVAGVATVEAGLLLDSGDDLAPTVLEALGAQLLAVGEGDCSRLGHTEADVLEVNVRPGHLRHLALVARLTGPLPTQGVNGLVLRPEEGAEVLVGFIGAVVGDVDVGEGHAAKGAEGRALSAGLQERADEISIGGLGLGAGEHLVDCVRLHVWREVAGPAQLQQLLSVVQVPLHTVQVEPVVPVGERGLVNAIVGHGLDDLVDLGLVSPVVILKLGRPADAAVGLAAVSSPVSAIPGVVVHADDGIAVGEEIVADIRGGWDAR